MGSNRRFSRRAFFKQTGAVVAALGLTDLAVNSGLIKQAEAYSQSLAGPLSGGSSSGRKLALLIGIDEYPAGTISPEQTMQLTGATTDVALQKELLIHRFGFLPSDILSLTNAEATRAGIYQAVVDHLCNQASAADTVVFHFSGYGAQVRIADLVGGQATQRSLVPYDGTLPTENRPILNDILETELKSLLGQIKAKNLTTVLDAGFVDITVPLSGGLRSRTRPVIATGQMPAPFERLTNDRMGGRIAGRMGGRIAKESAPFPGTLLRAATPDAVVLERQWEGFNAGVFTYVLTQYLWSAPAPVTVTQALGRSQEGLLRWGGSDQQPSASGLAIGNRNSSQAKASKSAPIYNTPLIDLTRAEGVVESVSANGQKVSLWLGGLPPRVLEYLGASAIMTCGGRRLQLRSRDGLTAQAKLIESAGNNGAPLQVGQPVFEAVRVLPKSINLVVALDSRLERIERVDATSALSTIAFVTSTSDTDLPADCLLAKLLSGGDETLTASLNPMKMAQAKSAITPEVTPEIPAETQGKSGYGLFSLMRSPIPGTLAAQEEAIKPAITRLTPKLQSLRALKMLRLSENRTTSKLPVRVSLEMVSPETKVLINRQTLPVSTTTTQNNALAREGFSPEVPIGSRVRYKLFNDGDLPLYYTLINVDPRERLSAFCPVAEIPTPAIETESTEETTVPLTAAAIAPGSAISIPSTDLDWAVEAPTGPVETYVVCSTKPLTKTFDTLVTAANSGGARINPLPEPLTVVEALLTDISQGDSTDAYTLDVAEWATLNFTYRAI